MGANPALCQGDPCSEPPSGLCTWPPLNSPLLPLLPPCPAPVPVPGSKSVSFTTMSGLEIMKAAELHVCERNLYEPQERKPYPNGVLDHHMVCHWSHSGSLSMFHRLPSNLCQGQPLFTPAFKTQFLLLWEGRSWFHSSSTQSCPRCPCAPSFFVSPPVAPIPLWILSLSCSSLFRVRP